MLHPKTMTKLRYKDAWIPYADVWYITQTLLACGYGPDVNRRQLCRGNDVIAEFNHSMHPWLHENTEALHKIANYLNEIEYKRIKAADEVLTS